MNPWVDKRLVEKREQYKREQHYKEFEGCLICQNQMANSVFTMGWRVVPYRKCEKHPRFYVEKVLVRPEVDKVTVT